MTQPMLRIDGALQAVDWEVALTAAAEGLQKAPPRGGAATGFLAAPMATVEELYLLAQIARGLGSPTSIIACASWIFAARRTRRRTRISGSRSPTSNASTACW